MEKALCGFGIAACLHENIEDVSIRVDRAPQPMFLATDRDHDFVHVPLVVRPWSIPADAVCEMLPKAIDPESDRFSADNHAPCCQKVFNIRRTQSKAMVRPNRVSNDLAGVAEAFKAWQINWNIRGADIPLSIPVNNLAIPV